MDIKKKLLAAASVVAVVVIAGMANFAGRSVTRTGIDLYERESAVSDIDTQIANEPFMQELRRVDPERAEAMADEMRTSIRTASSPEEARNKMLMYSKRTFADYRRDAPKASDAAIRSMVQTRITMFKALREHSLDACGRVAVGGAYPGMPDLQPKQIWEDATIAVIRAGHEGKTNPMVRSEPSEAAYQRYGELLRRAGVTERMLDVLGSGKLGELTTSEQCDLAIAVQEQALAMTGTQAPLVMAVVVTE